MFTVPGMNSLFWCSPQIQSTERLVKSTDSLDGIVLYARLAWKNGIIVQGPVPGKTIDVFSPLEPCMALVSCP